MSIYSPDPIIYNEETLFPEIDSLIRKSLIGLGMVWSEYIRKVGREHGFAVERRVKDYGTIIEIIVTTYPDRIEKITVMERKEVYDYHSETGLMHAGWLFYNMCFLSERYSKKKAKVKEIMSIFSRINDDI